MGNLMLNDMQKFFEVAKVSLWRLEIDNDECFLYGNDCFDELAGCDSNLSPSEKFEFFNEHVSQLDKELFKLYLQSLLSDTSEIIYRYDHPTMGQIYIRCCGTRDFDRKDKIVIGGYHQNVEKGEFCVLLGPSGSGKSTLLNILGGIDYPDGGEVKINGEKMNSLNSKKLTMFRRNHLGYVFQMYNLIPDLTVRENIEVGAYLSKKPLNLDELIETLGLKEHQDKLPSKLSGGQQQRTSIGRAIIKNPDILLCDEPTGALDYNTSKEILKLIEKVNQKYGSTVIMVTHNDAIKYMADRVVRLRDGQILKNYLNDKKVKAEDLEW